MRTRALAVLVMAAVLPGPAAAATRIIIAPYVGSVTNSNATYRIKDTSELDAIYAQWMNTEKFQVNSFYYRIPRINYSRVNDLQLSFDLYLKPSAAGKWVAGAGMEDQKTAMSAGGHIAPYTSFDMDKNVLFYYLRAGRYFYHKKGWLDASLFPYIGYAREKTTGEAIINAAITRDVSASDSYPLGGISVNTTFAQFIVLQANWMGWLGSFKNVDRMDEYTLTTGIYFSRHWGLSYRYKYKKYGPSASSYNLGSIVYLF